MKKLLAAAVFASVVLGHSAIAAGRQTPPVMPATGVLQNEVLEVKLKAETRAVPPGKAVPVQVEIKNRGPQPITLSRVQVGDHTVDALANKVIQPGKSVWWKGGVDVKLPSGKEVGMGTIDLLIESSAGVAGQRLDVERLEPFEIKATVDSRPVFGGAESSAGDIRRFEVSIKSRIPGKQPVTIDTAIPAGWTLLEGKATGTRELRTTGDQKRILYKVLVPIAAPVGEYPITLTIRTPTHTYTSQLTVAVTH